MLFVRLVFFCLSELNWLVIEVLLAAALVHIHSGDCRGGMGHNFLPSSAESWLSRPISGQCSTFGVKEGGAGLCLWLSGTHQFAFADRRARTQ